jgi:hypothetical protein
MDAARQKQQKRGLQSHRRCESPSSLLLPPQLPLLLHRLQ